MRHSIFFLIIASLLLSSCAQKETATADSFNVSGILLPEVVECDAGATLEFRVIGTNGPQEGDKVELAAQQSHVMAIDDLEKGSFKFTLSSEVYSGDYSFLILRGGSVNA